MGTAQAPSKAVLYCTSCNLLCDESVRELTMRNAEVVLLLVIIAVPRKAEARDSSVSAISMNIVQRAIVRGTSFCGKFGKYYASRCWGKNT
jgi:hypothetical protein